MTTKITRYAIPSDDPEFQKTSIIMIFKSYLKDLAPLEQWAKSKNGELVTGQFLKASFAAKGGKLYPATQIIFDFPKDPEAQKKFLELFPSPEKYTIQPNARIKLYRPNQELIL